MGINDPDCSPFEIHGLDPAQTPILFLEIVSDDFPNASSCRTYADEKFGQETLQMQAFRLPINVCSEQSAYGNGAGVAAARGHLDVPVIVEPSVVSDVGLRFSSGVGLGVASDFGLAPP